MNTTTMLDWVAEARGRSGDFRPRRAVIESRNVPEGAYMGDRNQAAVSLRVWSNRDAAEAPIVLILSAHDAIELSDNLFNLARERAKAENAAYATWETTRQERFRNIRENLQ